MREHAQAREHAQERCVLPGLWSVEMFSNVAVVDPATAQSDGYGCKVT